MMAGLSATGFVGKTLEEILADLVAAERAAFGNEVNTTSASVLGQLNGIFADALRKTWELAELVWDAQYPDTATGRSLTLISALTGTTRLAATKSTVTATCTLTAGTYAAGTLIACTSADSTARFVNSAEVVSVGGATSVPMIAETAGIVRANAGTLTVISSSVVGWTAVTNAEDAALGTDEETDAELRIRREAGLRAAGSTTVDAIRSDVLQNVTGVESCNVVENRTDLTDSDGIPPHSFEAIVYGPGSPSSADDQAVADQIFASAAAGIGTFGTTSKTVTDDQGNSHTVKFTRPTSKSVYLEIDVTVSTRKGWVSGGDSATALKQAIVDWATDNIVPGDDVIAERIKAVAFTQPGVVDVSALRLDFSASPVATANLAISIREFARFATTRIVVTEA